MGGCFCIMCLPILDDGRDDNSLTKEKQGRYSKIVRETSENKAPNLTLGDWILASPGLKPEHIIRSGEGEVSSSKSKKKVHPCVISEAIDSLCLDRPMNRDGETEEMLSTTSIGKSQKKVRFKLPHNLILYSPDPEEQKPYSGSESEGSFYSSICREYSFDSSAEEPFIRLAVDVLPHFPVSSKI